jgi:NAD(P)-dependent dehydrogenase (short-subunit alcohol dehydrogenase family)
MGYSALVTGSSRGIGLGLIEHLAASPDISIVFAAVRNPDAPKLTALAKKYNNKIAVIKMELEEDSAKVIFIIPN